MGAPIPSSQGSAAELRELFDGIDQGLDAHIEWSQRFLRALLLREPACEDVALPNAHELCTIGRWLVARRARLEELGGSLASSVEESHRALHDTARTLCAAKLAGSPTDPAELQRYHDAQSRLVHELSALRHVIVRATATRDQLTGLPLRGEVQYAYALRQRDAHRTGAELWVAMIDIDHFKAVNDRHGHAVGDATLAHVAATLQSRLRENDTLARYGGDEFLGLFLVTEPLGVELIAQRLLESLRGAPLRVDERLTLALTATVGIARAQPDELLEAVIERADHALYQGKLHGRNRYCVDA